MYYIKHTDLSCFGSNETFCVPSFFLYNNKKKNPKQLKIFQFSAAKKENEILLETQGAPAKEEGSSGGGETNKKTSNTHTQTYQGLYQCIKL